MFGIRDALLPERQRHPLALLLDQLDLGSGDTRSKRGGFVIMLTLSAVIATAGVLADSTATVIGAMIIAPLSTPILGIAIGIVSGHAGLVGRSLLWVLGGAAAATGIGALISFTIADSTALIGNSQIAGRTSPGLLDLLAALATGIAGAFAMSRKDLSAVLPGVAISISLVPPLTVIGVTLGHGRPLAALGAFVLFLSNVLALVIAGAIVFTLAGYTRDALAVADARRRRSYAVVAALALAVTTPLALNSVVTALSTQWRTAATSAAQQWVSDAHGAVITGAEFRGTEIIIEVRSPNGDTPPASDLRDALAGVLPDFIPITVEVTVGSTLLISDGTGG